MKKITAGFTDVILRRLDDEPTCNSPMKEQVRAIQQAFRANPEAADLGRAELTNSDKPNLTITTAITELSLDTAKNLPNIIVC